MDIKFDTLKYLVNNGLSMDSKEMTDKPSNLNIRDKKFYKKRLLAVSKSLFKEEEFKKSSKSIQLVFETYVKEMIEIFKDNDLNEERKKDYEDVIDLKDESIDCDESLNLLDYDIETMQQEKKQIKIEDCIDIKNLKKEKKPFFPKEEKYNLKSKKNKKKRNI